MVTQPVTLPETMLINQREQKIKGFPTMNHQVQHEQCDGLRYFIRSRWIQADLTGGGREPREYDISVPYK